MVALFFGFARDWRYGELPSGQFEPPIRDRTWLAGEGHMANCTACVSICEQKPYREVRSAYGILVAKGFDPHQCACVYVSPVCDSEKRWRMVKSLLREYHDWTATVTKDRMRPQSYHRIQNPWENRNTCSILLPERPRIAY